MNTQTVFGGKGTGDGIKVTSDTVYSFYTHTHVYNEMLIYEAFDGFITVNGERFSASEPIAALITPSDFHSITVCGKTEARFVKIAFESECTASYFHDRITSPILLRKHDGNVIFSTAVKRITEKNTSISYRKILLNTILLELCGSGEEIRAKQAKRSSGLVISAARIVTEEFLTDISLPSVAKRLHVTPQYLSAAFTRNMNVSFSEFLSGLRLNYAAGLLSDGGKSVTEVCYLCGYRDLSHFLRSFKKKFGATPKQYSKQR